MRENTSDGMRIQSAALSFFLLLPFAQANAENENPLLDAVVNNDFKTLDTLLARPENARFLNTADEEGHTIVYQSANFQMLKYLNDRGAAINASDTELIYNIIDGWAQSPQGMVESEKGIEFLLAKGVDPKPRLFESQINLLHASMSMNSWKITEMLVRKGVDVNGRDREGNTPMHSVSINFDFETPFVGRKIDLLLKAGADINAKNNNGTTPLMSATNTVVGQTAIELMNRGANVNLQDNDGFTALHWACWQHNDEAMIRAIVSHGASASLRTKDGKTARDYLEINSLLDEAARARLRTVLSSANPSRRPAPPPRRR